MAKARVILFTVMAAVVLLASTASAGRPCKTLFISSFSISTIHRNPNLINIRFPRYVTVFTEISQFNPKSDALLFDKFAFERQIQHQHHHHHQQQQQSSSPFWFSSSSAYDFSSLRDRTKDILSVVVALLFGVGCGALTAATMYLAWSLFSTRSSYDSYSDLDEEEDDYDIPSPKKMGYVNIPAADDKPHKQGA